ncbi:MAG: hypothetical protein DME53_01390 [Verrucomicrobia bacterium]|nr:MAG: hypothetical protein DME53_01390 [Verrucomicrobiota bacterium]
MNLGQGYAAKVRAVDVQHHFISTSGWRIARALGCSNEAIRIAHVGEPQRKPDRVSRITA